MGIVGTLLKNRRAGDKNLAWNLPGLSGPETLALTSPAFADGEAIPVEHAGKRVGGQEVSPQLAWTAPPEGTVQLLLVIEDIDVPMSSPFVHCLASVAPGVSALAPGALSDQSAADGVRVLRSTMGRGYVGPAPIKGHGPHRYVFQIFALGAPAAADTAAEQAKPRALLADVTGPVLGRGRLTGVYER
jgi:Raf kinase inhibitor-like YbhB/YbcL family protein